MRRIPTGLRGLAVGVLIVAAACSSSRSQESVGSTAQAVTNPTTSRVLSFEQPTTDWSAANLKLQQGDQFVDGQHSAAVTVVSSGGKLTSIPLSSLGPISPTVTLQVRLPAYVASTTYQGQVALWLNSPTAGVFNQYFGPFQFSNVPTGAFRQAQFSLPAAIVTALSSSTYSDLTASVELDFNPNPNPNAGFSDPFFIDKLDFGQTSATGNGGAGGMGGSSGSGGATGAGGSAVGGAGVGGAAGAHAQGGSSGAVPGGGAGTAGSAGTGTSGPCAFSAQPSGGSTDVAFTIKLPKGVRREDIGVGTTGGYLTLDDSVSIVKDSGGFASVSSVQATSRTNLGVGVQVQDLYTETTGIDLRTNAHVHGGLQTAADFTTQTGVVIDGGSLQNTSLQPLESISWNVSFPSTSRGSCSLEPDNTEVIDPGSYGDVAVKSRSHLKVRSGTYYFNSLSFEPQSVLDIDNSAGPVFLYVRTSFAFSGSVVETKRTHMNFLFGVAGSGAIAIQTAFRGILVAPFAGVSLPTDSSVGHVGAFFAQWLIAHQSTAIHLRPFAPSEFCASDAACSSFCPCGDDGGVCGGTPVNHGPAAADPNCVDGACCPTGATVVTLTPGADTSTNSPANACVLALAGNDTLSSAAPGVTIVGGDGDDTIKTSEFSASGTADGPMRVFGGSGNDAISGWFDGAQIYGGPGDDTISAGPGPVRIAPGSGADTVSSGEGDDTFILFSECEATPGKKLFANGGFDTLISPLSIDELRARGLTVEGFESVIIKSDACKADCTPKPNCGVGGQCSDRGGVAVCGGGTGASCQTCNDCASGFSCSSGTCQDPCRANPQAPGCSGGGSTPPHCSNGVRDGDESDVDCGGACTACPTGSGCATNADCGPNGVCGEGNGACFGHARAQHVCWSASCELGTEVGGCGDADSPCGQNCACVNGCDASSPLSTCAPGEICKKGFGRGFGAPTPDVCVDSRCPSNDPALCGSATSLCGTQCVCPADCSHATCQNPSDGCGGTCPDVCKNGETGCLDDVNCPTGYSCLPNGSGGSTCRPGSCAFRVLAPPLCGVSGALCGDTCPACTPSCENRQCGADPVCGQSCGTCAAGAFCNSDGQCVTPTADSPPTVPDGQGAQRPLPDLPPSPTNAVGALKGQFSVSDDGTAQYSIPIEVPPGRAGMEPALTLTYSASHLNQDAGVGWHLEGLSKITRCPRSFALDGYSAPVQNDKTDLFCLDGKRLESVSGTYGADGTEYRTLIDSFAKIVSHIDPGIGIQLPQLSGIPSVARELQGPDSFQVFTKDGRILSFGRTSDSLVLARNGIRYAWLLNRVEDRAGNTMLVTYTNIPTMVNSPLAARQPNIVRAASISYTGHGDTPGNRSVGFEYETRNDPQVAFFQGGVSFIAPERLSRVTTFVKGVAVKNYHLQYGPGVLSQVAQISECAGGDDSQCKAPTKFDYTEAHGFSAPQRFDGDDFGTAGELDADGDGVPDFLVSKVKVGDVDANPNLEAAQVTTDVAIGVASSFLSPVGYVAVNVIWDVIQGPFWGMFGSDPSVTVSNQLRFGSRDRSNPLTFVNDISGIRCDTAYNPMFLLDYDQDGKDDIISACGLHSGALFVALSGSARGQLIKFPADGKSVLSVPIGPHPTHGNATPVSTEPPPIMMDVDGDSLQDVIGCEDPYTLDLFRRARPATGSSPLQMTQGFEPTPIQLFAPPAPPNPSGSHEPPPRPKLPLCDGPAPAYKPFDVDGDGTPDLLVRGPSGWVVLRYVAAGGAPSLSFQPVKFIDVGGGTGSAGGALTLGDFNGDGLQDIRDNGDRNMTVWLNAGGGVFTARRLGRPRPPVFIGKFPYSRRATTSLDYNGDGQSDLLENWGFTQDVGGGEVIVHNANAAFLPDSVVQLLNPVDVPEIKFTLETGQSFPSAFTTSADLDADGSTDVFGANGQVFYGNSAKNTLLSRVADGLGNFVNVEYDRSDTYSGDTCVGNWPEKCLHHANGLVARHTEGFASSSGADVSERTYTYHYVNGRMSVTGHGWLGFDRRTIDLQAQTGESSTTTIDYEPVARFDLGGAATQSTTPPYIYPFAGLVKTTTVDVHTSTGIGAIKPPLQSDFFDSRSQTINTWRVKMSAFNRPFPFVGSRLRSTYERPVTGGAFLNPTRPSFEDNGALVTQCTDGFTLDGYGNVTQGGSQCQGIESFLDEENTITSFLPDPIGWIISNPVNVKKFSTHFGKTTEREFALTYSSAALPHTVTRAPSGTSDQQKQTTYDRDDFGNVNQITEVAPGETTRVTKVTYDVDKIFPKIVTNPEGQTTQIEFDPRWGTPKAVVDPNGLAAQTGYDGFGRQTQVSDATGTSIATYSSIAAPNTVTAIGAIEPRFQMNIDRVGAAGTRDGSSITEYDNYGRVVRRHAEGFGGAEVISEQAFDPLGRSLGRTLPHTADTSPAPFDRYSYDGLQRFARIDHSDGSFREIQYATSASLDPSHSQWTNGMTCPFGLDVSFCAVGFTLTVDEEGRQNAVVTDFEGRVVRNVDGENLTDAAKTSNYVYGPFSTLTETHDNRDLVTSFQFDDYGRLLSRHDPDTRSRSYTYNGFDEVRTSFDPNHELRTYNYDSLGRIDHVVDSAGTTQWIYDQGVNGLGRLSASISPPTTENPLGQQVSYTYESPTSTGNRGLVQSVTYTIDGTDYPINFDYDDLGRTSRIHYPNPTAGQPIVARYTYDNSGVLNGVDEVGSGVSKSLWRINDVFQGHLIQDETFGNGAKTTYGYNPARRWLENVQTTLGTEQIQSLAYTHYKNGLVHGFAADNAVPVEYIYDKLNRLWFTVTHPFQSPAVPTEYSYDDIGNLTQRAGVTTHYRDAQPHLIASVGENIYQYDANGNVINRHGTDVPDGNQTFDYTPFDLPRSITNGGISPVDLNTKTVNFDYSADQERVLRRDPDSVRHFVGDLYQRKLDTFGTTLEERFRLYAGDRQLGEIVRKDGTDKTLYFHTDHLGSTDTISDSDGGATTQHFDPFGTPLSPPNPELTRVGFTGQDQDVDLSVTDMKGRIYDPLAGRFTSPDPVMQAPFWSQGLNRYSYVFNDPINHTDPSGFDANGEDSTLGIMGWGAGVVGAAALSGFGAGGGSILAGGAAAGANAASPFGFGGLAGAARSGGTYSVAPTAAPQASSVTRETTQAKGQNSASVKELAMPDFSVPDSIRGPDLREAAIPHCGSPDHIPGKTACVPPGTSALDFVPGGEGVVIEEAEVSLKLLSRLIGRLLGRVGRNVFGETVFKGLVRNRILSELTDAEIRNAFKDTTFKLSSHAVMRLRDPRAAAFGLRTLRDVEGLLNKGVIEQAGHDTVLVVKDGFQAVVNVSTKVIVTFSPY